MNFSNSFDVKLPPAQAWLFLMDVQRVVPCMPGAELTEIVDEKTFRGKISVRLGPVLLTFACDAAFDNLDPVAHEARLNARGADTKGRGTVKSSIRFRLSPAAAGSTVTIDTELALSGAVAQYGRGAAMMQSVANQLVSQFSSNLDARIAAQRSADPSAAGTGTTGTGTGGAPGAATAAPAAPAAGEVLSDDGRGRGHDHDHAHAHDHDHGNKAPWIAQKPAKPINGFAVFFAALLRACRGWFSRKSNP